MRITIYILIIFMISNFTLIGQEIPIPENYNIVDNIFGDLDNDNINELVVVYNTKTEKDYESVPRELIIYKLKNNKWIEWKKSRQALYGSQDGGMMGDPFEQIEIKNGILLISQSGGSSWKWGFTDKYRFQAGEFYLIGYTSSSGKLCNDWKNVDFNLVTGKMIVNKEYEDCEKSEQEIYKKENEILFKKGLKITIQNRNEKEIKLITPKYKHEIYLAIKIEQ